MSEHEEAQETDETTDSSTDSGTNEHMIPKSRFDQVLAERNELREKVGAGKKKQETKETEEKPEPASGPDDDIKSFVQTMKAEREIQSALGLTGKKASVVADVMQKVNGLTADEALQIAKARHADVFSEDDQRGFQDGSHTYITPAGGESPNRKAQDPVDSLKEAFQKESDPKKRKALHVKYIGALTRRRMGL